jgi:transposase
MDYIGIDVQKKESQLCIRSAGGELVEQRIRTTPERFAVVIGGRSRARILLEASTESEWVARCLEGLGHEVIVADPNFAPMYAARSRKIKTDRRDARVLAEACLLGAYRPAHRLSDAQRHVRGRLTVRDALVRTRTGYIAVIRALLRQHGWRVPTGSAEGFIRRILVLPVPGRLLSEVVQRGPGEGGHLPARSFDDDSPWPPDVVGAPRDLPPDSVRPQADAGVGPLRRLPP